ncbi:MAG TPA: hypothetical protein VJQ54_15330 [Candidatus Sulfotelmatobacter sp.]|nr:hypothetical protein [Candidatus Sulfotelmatobacter sp.]
MQTLGLSDTTTRTESRFKSLFWPSIQSGADVDYLAVQGFWVCTIVGVLALVFLTAAHQPLIGFFVFILFHVGGVGVREHNPWAAAAVLIYFALDTWVSGIGVVRIIVTALLLSNLRATWIADHWKPESEEAALPPRYGDTFSDKLADKWPAFLWPKVKWLYYIFSFALLALAVAGLIVLFLRRSHMQ